MSRHGLKVLWKTPTARPRTPSMAMENSRVSIEQVQRVLFNPVEG